MPGRTLLGVWAHPDDEAYLSAGLMLDFVERGDRVVVVTATPGEHGTGDPQRWPPRRLAALRRKELRNSLAAVGVHEHHVRGLEDGRCDEHDGTDAVARHIVTARPDVIVTFGPDGMTGHPDHRAVSRWTTDAWARTGSTADLWYATITPEFHERWNSVHELIGLWADQPQPPRTPGDELAHTLTLSGDRLDTKLAALQAHRSQTAPLSDLIGLDTFRMWWATESFRAAPRSCQRAAIGEREPEPVLVK